MFLETCSACASGGGGMSVGDNGFEGNADPTGPAAGYDKPLKKILKRIRKVKATKNDISATNALGEKDNSSQLEY